MLSIEQFKYINKNDKVLVIVESPNKVKTISQFLPKNIFTVKATVGHLYHIADGGEFNMGIDTKKAFTPNYQLLEGKDKTINEIKNLCEHCNKILICSDADREGEFIAYSIKTIFNIPDEKYQRCTFHEITEKAILNAINNPTKIDYNLVSAAETRSILDKLVGYRLSPISKSTVNARSVGRCQSVALRLIVDREEEIRSFDSKQFFEIWATFIKNRVEYKAQYKGLLNELKNTPTIASEKAANKILEECKKNDFIVESIIQKERAVAAKPPFITSTYQQEVSSKLGYPVKKAQEIAQKLFEGININGKHVACITYLRTDSTSMNAEFESELGTYIENIYGKKYFSGKRKTKKAKNSQDGHECLRCVDLSLTPEKLSKYISDSQLIKVYSLIYARTVASLMSDAIIIDTEYKIKCGKYKFSYVEHTLKFEGWKAAYGIYDDEKESITKIGLKEKEKLNITNIEKLKKKTSPPSRYTESSLVKQLDSIGVGRPSTFSSIVSILLDPKRNYCIESGKSIKPTEIGEKLIQFLLKNFTQLFDYHYSATLEDDLDLIANGKLDRVDFLSEFYSNLEKTIDQVPELKMLTTNKKCPICGGQLIIRQSRFGKFLGCSNYPKCKHIENIAN